MHYDLILITEKNIDKIDIQHLWLKDAEVFVGKVNSGENTYTYDYLVIDKVYPKLNLLTEFGFVITNQFFQSTNDYIYAIGGAVKSVVPVVEQLKIVLSHIKNPF